MFGINRHAVQTLENQLMALEGIPHNYNYVQCEESIYTWWIQDVYSHIFTICARSESSGKIERKEVYVEDIKKLKGLKTLNEIARNLVISLRSHDNDIEQVKKNMDQG